MPNIGGKGFIIGNRFIETKEQKGKIEIVSPTNMTSMEDDNFKILSTGQYSDRYAYYAFDSNSETIHDARGNIPRILGYQRKDGKKNTVISYSVYPGGGENINVNDLAGQWKLQGSNDGDTWEDIHVQEETYVRSKWKVGWNDFVLDKESKPYSYIRWYIIKNASGESPDTAPWTREFKVIGRLV